MNEVINREQAAGRLPADLDVTRLSPAIHAHVDLNGRDHIHPDQPPRLLTHGRDTLATYQYGAGLSRECRSASGR